MAYYQIYLMSGESAQSVKNRLSGWGVSHDGRPPNTGRPSVSEEMRLRRDYSDWLLSSIVSPCAGISCLISTCGASLRQNITVSPSGRLIRTL